MKQHRVVICCWLCCHQTEISLTLRQEEALPLKIKKLKAVCPECRSSSNQPIFIHEGRTVFNPFKLYKCERGHATRIGTLNNNVLHIAFGPNHEDFVNIEGTIEELPELLDNKDISCHHVVDGKPCDSKLCAVDNFALTYPTVTSIKTKTRIGDLWDRAGVEPVRPGHYDADGNYRQTKSETSNKERLKRMRNRNTPMERQPGKRIDRATNTDYGYRSKSEVKPERLNGPQ